MAQRYLNAMDYSDWHAQNILNKHAKKRPLGYIENKYNVTLAQPVLTFHDIDISGNRSYRPKSTAQIIEEQHKFIHKIFESARNISSAPAKRVTSAKRRPRENSIKIEVKGKPIPYVNKGFQASRKSARPSTHPELSGHDHEQKSSFMVVKVDPQLIKKTGINRDLTQQIRTHWDSVDFDIGKGSFVRGKKRPVTVPAKTGAWLTFGGTQEDESSGVVDAFASWKDSEQYYTIDGDVGVKVAKQLQRGDKIRIGINGEVQSDDLRIASSRKDKEVETEREEEKHKEQKKENELDDFDFSMEGSEYFFNEMSKLMENKLKPLIEDPPPPLCWEDQFKQSEIKILTPRITHGDCPKTNNSESKPVIYGRLSKPSGPPHRAWSTRSEGYKVKHRLKSESLASRQRDPRAGRIKVMSIDQRSREEEEKLNSISIDEILRMALSKPTETTTCDQISKQNDEDLSLVDLQGLLDANNSTQNNHASSGEVSVSHSGDQLEKNLHSSVNHPASDLSIVTPGAKNKPALNETTCNYRRTPAKPPKGHRVGFSGITITSRSGTGETEYIKITSQIGNIKQIPAASRQTINEPSSPVKVTGLAIDDPLLHSPLGPHPTFVTKIEDYNSDETGGRQPSLASPFSKSPPPSFQISIPTGDDVSDGESQVQPSPQRNVSLADDIIQDAVMAKEENKERNEEVDEITSMLDANSIKENGIGEDNKVKSDVGEK